MQEARFKEHSSLGCLGCMLPSKLVLNNAAKLSNLIDFYKCFAGIF